MELRGAAIPASQKFMDVDEDNAKVQEAETCAMTLALSPASVEHR